MLIVAIVLAVVVGIGFAYGIVAKQVCDSNNYGDYVGEVKDFAQGTWDVVGRKDYKSKKQWTQDKAFMEQMRNVV